MTQVEVNPGWEARYQQVLDEIPPVLTEGRTQLMLDWLVAHKLLTPAEAERSSWKIALLEPVVRRMIANMIKGTLKHPSDDWPLDTWVAMSMDDTADMVNYSLLTQDKLRKMGVL